MLDQDELLGAEQLLGNDDAPEGIGGTSSSLEAQEFRLKGQREVFGLALHSRNVVAGPGLYYIMTMVTLTFRMTWASPRLMPNAWAGSIRASMQVRMRYFFAGGRGSLAWVKVAPYFAEDHLIFCWMAVCAASDIPDDMAFERGMARAARAAR